MSTVEHLTYECERWKDEISRELWSYGIIRFQQREEDLLRYLNWKVWSMRYGVSLRWIIKQIMERNEYSRDSHRRAITSMGLKSVMITGKTTEVYIRERVLEDFPNGENLMAMRAQVKDRITGKGRMAREVPEQERTRRAWRGNPWR